MIDTQSFFDKRRVKIAKVGIKNLSHPIFFTDSDEKENTFPTVGNFSFFVELPAEKKGTHMSRFPLLLSEFAPDFSLEKFEKIAFEINEKLSSETAFINVAFPYFYEQIAPVSKSKGMGEAFVNIEIKAGPNKQIETKLNVRVTAKSVCPCSKAISDFGAHSQRSQLEITLWNPKISIRHCIEIAESAASSPVYSVLKRDDEKFVTEAAYNKPRFVEDLVREMTLGVKEYSSETKFEVCAENFESIHNHNAFAAVRSEDII